jgi:hypothetical protein
MKQKIFFSGVLTICILASAACTSAPTTNNTQNFTAPTQASSTNLNLDATPQPIHRNAQTCLKKAW